MQSLWHLGLAVPDLRAATDELTTLFGVTWRPPVVRSLTARAGDRTMDVDVRVTFSLGGPVAFEAWEGVPGTPLAVPGHGWFHHLGYWTDDLPAERERLEGLGYAAFLTSEPSLSLNRGPGGLGLEPCDLNRDQPYLRDLFPADSPFHGEPEVTA